MIYLFEASTKQGKILGLYCGDYQTVKCFRLHGYQLTFY